MKRARIPRRPERPESIQLMRSVLLGMLAFAVVNFIGYALTSLVYRFTGRPPEIVVSILSGVVGICVVGLAGRIYLSVHSHKHQGAGHDSDQRMHLLDKTIEALNRIAQGDFSVLMPVDEHDPFSHLAESVNKMARELGSMENLRQDFISNVSHEIQSPLTSISGFAAILRKDDLSVELRAHYLEIIETEAKRLSKLSDNLLKLSSLENNLQPLTFAPFALNKQIENAVLMLEPQWSAKDLNLDLSLEKLSYSGDEGLLSQVWINLLHNAVKFTLEGGNIAIALEGGDDEVTVRIADSGPGIAPEDQIHIFERFYKADKSRDRSLGGNGLGLSLVKKIVELHGGVVSVQSEPGSGSTFRVALPK